MTYVGATPSTLPWFLDSVKQLKTLIMNTTTSSSTFVVLHRVLGVSDPGVIPDSAFLASSQRNSLDYSAAKALKEGANLDSGEWCSYYNDTNQWLQAKLSYHRKRKLDNLKMELIFINSSIQLYRINTSMDGENWSFETEVNIKNKQTYVENVGYRRRY